MIEEPDDALTKIGVWEEGFGEKAAVGGGGKQYPKKQEEKKKRQVVCKMKYFPQRGIALEVKKGGKKNYWVPGES